MVFICIASEFRKFSFNCDASFQTTLMSLSFVSPILVAVQVSIK